ncbi:MAG TPA: Shedu anti-phage system protein SduA domain-containing protein [Acidimicrobiales bacterium]|nr:Shedu anti-phage system protein SduA domain-containing protein [Acidimicrobiales bacterium]
MSREQLALAKVAGCSIDLGTPSLVAAAMLRDGLSDHLCLRRPGELYESTYDYLARLASVEGVDPAPSTRDEAEAWIAHCYLLRRRRALAELKLEADDVIEIVEGPNAGRVAAISSISSDGVIYLKGRGQAWPDHVRVRARGKDSSPEADNYRRLARNDAAARRGSEVSFESTVHLAPYRVRSQLSMADIAQLAEVIDMAADERPIQARLTDQPHLLAALLSHDPRYCLPQVALGNSYQADFFLADVDSTGIRWILVELESPRAELALATSNQFSKEVRKGISQVSEWREWLSNNLASAKNLPRDDGLGLTGIRPNADGMVLVGRRAKVGKRDQRLRNREWETNRIRIHTYDWLLETLSGIVRFSGPPAANPFLLQRSTEDAGEGESGEPAGVPF